MLFICKNQSSINNWNVLLLIICKISINIYELKGGFMLIVLTEKAKYNKPSTIIGPEQAFRDRSTNMSL